MTLITTHLVSQFRLSEIDGLGLASKMRANSCEDLNEGIGLAARQLLYVVLGPELVALCIASGKSHCGNCTRNVKMQWTFATGICYHCCLNRQNLRLLTREQIKHVV